MSCVPTSVFSLLHIVYLDNKFINYECKFSCSLRFVSIWWHTWPHKFHFDMFVRDILAPLRMPWRLIVAVCFYNTFFVCFYSKTSWQSRTKHERECFDVFVEEYRKKEGKLIIVETYGRISITNIYFKRNLLQKFINFPKVLTSSLKNIERVRDLCK